MSAPKIVGGRAQCSECREWFKVLKTGRLAHHSKHAHRGYGTWLFGRKINHCPGSGAAIAKAEGREP